MFSIRFNLVVLLCLFFFSNAPAQALDTLVDVGGYHMHFHILKGKGVPILFDAGGGDNATVWNDILPLISEKTGAPLIAYDRPGFGKSTLDKNKHGLLNGIIGLETGLRKLGYEREIMLVAHSQGALYATAYAYRHPDKVKAAVLIDGSTACWFDPRLAAIQQQNDIDKLKIKDTNAGMYYQLGDLKTNIDMVRGMPFPATIPVIDLVSGNPPFDNAEETDDWRRCHSEFVQAGKNRIAITAYDCGHYIFRDNPSLVVDAVVKMYSGLLAGKAKAVTRKRY